MILRLYKSYSERTHEIAYYSLHFDDLGNAYENHHLETYHTDRLKDLQQSDLPTDNVACHIDSQNATNHEHEKRDIHEHEHESCSDDNHAANHDHVFAHDHQTTGHGHLKEDARDHEHAETYLPSTLVLDESISAISNIDEEHKEAFSYDEPHYSDHVKSNGTTSPMISLAKETKETKSIMFIPTAKDREKEKVNTLFGKLVEQDANRPQEEQTRFVKMVAGGLLPKNPEDDMLDVPDLCKIYLAQPIEKEGVAENWDSFTGAEKESTSVTPPLVPVSEVKKVPNALTRLIFGDRRGSASETDLLQEKDKDKDSLPSSPIEPVFPVFPDDIEAVPSEVNGPDGKPIRKKSIIMGAMDLLRGKKKEQTAGQELPRVLDDDGAPEKGDVCI